MADINVVVAPTLGNPVVNLQAGVGASPGFDAIDYRRAWGSGAHEGVVAAGAHKVHQATTASLHVLVDAHIDAAYVQGDAVTKQGMYYVAPHSAQIDFNVGASDPPDPTSPRIDRVVLRVYDNTHDAFGLNQAQVVYMVGTPTAGATLDNENGAPALPGGACELATVQVRAGATTITDSGDIRDKRPAGGHRQYQIGEVIWKGSANAPFGCVAADGLSTYKRNAYVELFADYGTTHSAGDGSTTFGVPDLRGRSPIGAGTGSGLTNRVLGTQVGEESHALTAAESGVNGSGVTASADHAHSHNTFSFVSSSYTSGGLGALQGTRWTLVVGSNGGAIWTAYETNQYLTAGDTGATDSQSIAHAHALVGRNADSAHNNMQPSLALQPYIYAGKA